MDKYGVEFFDFSILEKIEAEDAYELKIAIYEAEAFWIDYFKFLGFPLYNQRPASISNKGVKRGPAWNKGVPMSNEKKELLLKANKGRQISKEHKESISKANKGRVSERKGKTFGPLSEETKLKLSKANKGKPFSEEHKKSLSKARFKVLQSLKEVVI
jgi:hypothetical protein